jgi:hypothetical protein
VISVARKTGTPAKMRAIRIIKMKATYSIRFTLYVSAMSSHAPFRANGCFL